MVWVVYGRLFSPVWESRWQNPGDSLRYRMDHLAIKACLGAECGSLACYRSLDRFLTCPRCPHPGFADVGQTIGAWRRLCRHLVKTCQEKIKVVAHLVMPDVLFADQVQVNSWVVWCPGKKKGEVVKKRCEEGPAKNLSEAVWGQGRRRLEISSRQKSFQEYRILQISAQQHVQYPNVTSAVKPNTGSCLHASCVRRP